MTKEPSMHIHLTECQKERLKILSENFGFSTVSEYVRFLAFNPTFEVKFEQIIKLLNEIKNDLKKIVQE